MVKKLFQRALSGCQEVKVKTYELRILAKHSDENGVMNAAEQIGMHQVNSTVEIMTRRLSICWYFDTKIEAQVFQKKLIALLPECIAVKINRIRLVQPEYAPLMLAGINIVPLKSKSIPPNPSKKKLYVNGANSFGIGTHPTTQLCAEWIQKSAAESESFLDIGSGSGVLLLLASGFRIKKVHGIEPDPDSYRISSENIRINRAANCKVYRKKIKKISGKQLRYDLVCANLESRFLEEYCEEIVSWVRLSGRLILSGMIKKNRKSVVDCYRSCGFRLCGSRTSGEWCSVVLEKVAA